MKNETENLLDEATAQVRERTGDSSQIEESSGRIWRKIEGKAATGCARFSSLIASYHNGSLDEAQRTLLQEHMKECFTCKSKLRRLQSGKLAGEHTGTGGTRAVPPWMKWGSLAAGLVIMIMAAQFMFWAGMLPLVSADAVTVGSLEGSLYTLDGQDILPVAAGDVYSYGKTLRTGPKTGAIVSLRDGSEVELAERTEFSVVGGWKGDSIRLNRGNIIIRASDQGSGRLRVLTEDCDVTVKGTIFSVRHGLKGSRVSVIEGEVWVKRGENNTVLNAGQQYSSRENLGFRTVAEEINWSRNSSEYLKTLALVSDIHRAIDQVTMSKELRYTGALARILPRDTVIYGAAPNVVDRGDLFFQAIDDAIADNSKLAEAWNSEKGLEIQAHIEELKDLASSLEGLFGDELVFAIARVNETGPLPILLTEVHDVNVLKAELTNISDRISQETGGIRPISVIEDPFASGLPDSPLFAWCTEGLLAVSPSLDLLKQVSEADAGNGSTGFVESPLYETVATQYDQGVDWLLAVDLQAVLGLVEENREADVEDAFLNPLSGVGNLLAKRRLVDGQTENQLIFSFNEEPRGVLGWLAEPMPMGAMDFVSPDASLAAGFSLRDPLQIMDELLEHIASADGEALEALEEFQNDMGLDIREDIAASLGGEVLFALDGPILPTPAWKLILEVYDPARFQGAVESLVSSVNARLSETGQAQLSFGSEQVGGNTLYSLHSAKSSLRVYYMFARGYMIAAPDYSIISKALQYQSSGYSLVNSPDFIASLPSGDSVDLSAFYYHDFRSVLDAIQEATNAANVDSLSFLTEMENGPSHFMSGVYRTDNELVISSNNNFQDCWSFLGVLGTLRDLAEGKIN
ncbi:MAG: FecR family protein [Acidobacteriota bacterium]